MTQVRDSRELVALYIRPGAVAMHRRGTRGGPGGRFVVAWDGGHEPYVWKTNRVLWLYRTGDAYSVHLWMQKARLFAGT